MTTIDGRETAPAAMRPDSFWENGAPLPFNDARYSGLSVGVPGTVETGTRRSSATARSRSREALAPAIRVARDGFVVDQTFFDQTQGNVDWFDDIPASAALYLDPDGTPRDVGSVFRNPDLARHVRADRAPRAQGLLPGRGRDALVDTVQHPLVSPTANHVWRPGLMTMRDLHNYKAPERPPTHVAYRGLDVYGMGPPSSGGSTVGEALNILEGYALGDDTRGGTAPLHRGVALLVRRPRRLPRRSGVLRRPADGAALRRVRGHAARPDHGDRATSPVAPGDPYPFDGRGHGAGQAATTETRAGTTTHITTADRSGNVVAYTFTIESTGGAGLVVPGYGFLRTTS